MIYGAAGGPLNFGYKELTGHRELGPASDAACAPHALSVEAPIVVALGKSGGWSESSPTPRSSAFLKGPDIRLPAGDWLVTAAAISARLVGDGFTHDLTAPIELHVTD